MDSYERVMTTLEHREPDRPPINYIATPEMNRKLKKHLGIEDQGKLLEYLGVDFRYVSGKFVGPKYLCGEAGVNAVGKDIWGVVWKTVRHKFGVYNEIDFHPLEKAKTVEEIEQYSWPNPDWYDMSNLKEEIKRLNEKERKAIIFFGGGAFETPWYIRGMERFLMDIVECPEIAEAICRNVVKFYSTRIMRAIEESDNQIDIIGSGGDIGTQRGMMLSPSLWRKYIKPWSRKLIEPFKKIGLKTFYHTCGSVVPVIEDFIEMGLDILDPIQPKAFGMNPEFLKENFGSRLSFHGGIDEQELLPTGSPEDVESEVLKIIDILGENGGYIVAPAHALQPDTPAENVLALYRTACGYRY